MSSITSKNDIYQDLEEGNYQKVIDFYESTIDNEPNNLSNYWYLGLAYLLQGQEEEAQVTWFLTLNQQSEEDFSFHIQELVKILEKEAERQEEKKDDRLAWLIRSHIRELQWDNLSNLLSLIILDDTLGLLTTEKIVEWNVIEVLSSIEKEDIGESLLKKALEKILPLMSDDSLEIARICLEKFSYSNSIIETITTIVFQLSTIKSQEDSEIIKYQEKLLNLCRHENPNNLKLIDKIYCLYTPYNRFDKYYEKALIYAQELIEKSDSLFTEIFGYYRLLYIHIKIANWEEALNIFSEYLNKLNEFKNQTHYELETEFLGYLTCFTHFLFYYQDKPAENRYFCNLFGNMYQDFVNLKTQKIAGIEEQIFLKEETNFVNKDSVDQLKSKKILKIGYIGATLRSHSVGFLSRWLIQYHDPEKFKIYIFYLDKTIDSITEDWFVKHSEKFYFDCHNSNILTKKIQESEIDILIDLDSLTSSVTCSVMAKRAAPIQVTWLGLDAAGIPNIDYFIADPYVLPDNAQDYYAEKIWRLPDTYLAIDGFEANVPTLRRSDLNIPSDAIIFLNVQAGLKLHPDIVRLQLKIIKSLPNSYLLVKSNAQKTILENLFTNLAREEGVEIDRLRFLGRTLTPYEHRANLAIADVILDTYPYNGATTTLECLWMGIPIVTKVGEQFAARNSYTFMVNAGISEGIAWTDEEYVEWGIKLGTDESLRQEISWKLTESRKTAPIWDTKQFTQEMENAYQQMWQIYLQSLSQ